MNHNDSNHSSSVLIVDSFALLFRGYYAMAMSGNEMKTSYGLYTNGIYQFTKYMLHAIDTFKPSHVVCAFDMGESTFRNEMYDQYKANRQAPPEQLIPQFDKLWELVDAFNIPCLGVNGYEADDVIGTVARSFASQKANTTILTGDGDTLQLISDNTQVALMKRGFGNYEVVTLDNLESLRGIKHPSQIIELKALMGDASDNIPGCPGVGPKTALKLINEYGTVDRLFENIDEVTGKLKERLEAHKDQIYLSHRLATIHTDVPIQCRLEDCVYKVDQNKLIAKLEEFEFKSFIKTLFK